MKNRVLSAKNVKGKKVYDMADEHIGKIEDLMVNMETGNVAYALLSLGGILGIADSHYAIPVEALDFTAEGLVLDVEKEKLVDAPTLEKDQEPSKSSPDFLESMYHHYGFEQPFSKRSHLRKR